VPLGSRRRSPFPAVLAAVSVVALFVTSGAVTRQGASGLSADAGPLGPDAAGADAAGPATVVRPRAEAAVGLSAGDPSKVSLGLSLVKSGFIDPVLVTSPRDGSKRLFVVEQAGRIRIISGGTLLATPFLDLRGAITSGGERGLLGLAFHPKFATNHFIYVNFTDVNGNTAISRYTVSSNPNVANRFGGLRILTIKQPYANHNGGNIAFGADGYLYIGMGDGGGTGDPGNRAQNLGSLLGKMLRIDVDHQTGGKRYAIPPTNPFANTTGLDEIWSRGLRNPWRWSFDRSTRQLWIGDVGQSRWEEIDRSSPSSTHPAGWAANYGWPALEGRACYRPSTGCSTRGKTAPLVVYGHSATTVGNCSVTGGFVYRGAAYPVLSGVYLFGDFCSGRIWGVSATAASPATPTLLRSPTASPRLSISSFGEDEAGEMYVADHGGGRIYKITATAKP
jgi:glucose/arabinose dehydrogenase